MFRFRVVRCFRWFALASPLALSGCDWLTYGPIHLCDASKAIDLRDAAAFIGRWHTNPKGGLGFGVDINERGRFLDPDNGCSAPGMLPMVVGDYNRNTAIKNQGEGYIRLRYAKITKDYFEFVWGYCRYHDDCDEVRLKRVGRILEDGVMLHYDNTNARGFVRYYKIADEVDGFESGESEPSSPSQDDLTNSNSDESTSTGAASWGEESSQ